MKKLLCIALIVCLVFALAAPVFASGEPSSESPSGGGGATDEPGGGSDEPGGGSDEPGGGSQDDQGGKNAGKSTASNKSPQTGYSTVVWTIAGVAMLIGAGYCFSASRKVVAE